MPQQKQATVLLSSNIPVQKSFNEEELVCRLLLSQIIGAKGHAVNSIDPRVAWLNAWNNKGESFGSSLCVATLDWELVELAAYFGNPSTTLPDYTDVQIITFTSILAKYYSEGTEQAVEAAIKTCKALE